MSRIKAGIIPVKADVRARLIFTLSFYSNQVFSMCVNTKTRLMCGQCILKNQASIQNRLLYETCFNTRHRGISKNTFHG